MKAAVQVGSGSPDALELRDVEPPIVADDAVLVRIRAASINAFDWGLVRLRGGLVLARLFGGRPSPIRGADLAGVVEACGRSVSRFKPGDEVFGVARGTLAEFATTTEARLAPKSRSLTFEQAATLPVAGCTALQGLRDHAGIQAGQRVLVYGAGGGTGTFAVQIAKALEANVTAVTRTENLELMRSIGADHVIDYTRQDFARRSERYDVVFDIGANRSFSDYERVLSPAGKLVLVGAPKQVGALIVRLIRSLSRAGGRRITVMAKVKPEDLITLDGLAESGRLSPVIDRTYPLSAVAEAFRHFASGQVRGKVVISVPG